LEPDPFSGEPGGQAPASVAEVTGL